MVAGLHVARCSREAARWALKRWHFTGDFPKTLYHSFGVWEGGKFVGVLTYSPPAMVRVDKYYGVQRGELVELSRVAMGRHNTPTSRIIAIATRMFLKATPACKMLVTYCSPDIGHIGTVFQGAGWVYVGQGAYTWVTPHHHSRSLIGDRGLTIAQIKALPGARRKPGAYRYVLPVAEECKQWAEEHKLPYPKRASVAQQLERADPIGEKAVQVRPGRSAI